MGYTIMLNLLILIRLLVISCLLLQPLSLLAADNKTILIFSADGEKFAQTAQGIKDDLGGDFNIIKEILTTDSSVDNINHTIKNSLPSLIVLIGNTPALKYTRYQQQYTQQYFPPSVLISALYINRLLPKIKNAQGIRHEIPAITSALFIRSLVEQPVRRVGVLYRKWMRNYIQLNAKFCKQEGIELVAIEVSNRISLNKVNYHLRHLLKQNIDALWVVNDNALFSSQIIQNVWLPNIKQFNKPVIVGIEALTTTPLNFGTFAVVPDQYALGIQGAGLIADILDDGIEQLVENKLYEPISVKKSLNLTLMEKRNIKINQSKLDTLDYLTK
jgi:hypothetical protein